MRGRRDARPAWVRTFIDRVADCFEPLDDVGRVGFVCRPADEGWAVTMYLGRTEIVGGPDDGVARSMAFHFDVQSVLACFSQVDRVRWTACPELAAPVGDDQCSLLRIDGQVEESRLQLMVTAVPPEGTGPGLRRYPDGRCNPA